MVHLSHKLNQIFRIKLFLILLLVGGKANVSSAQIEILDSLKLELKKTQHDSTKCKTLDLLIESENNDAVWPVYNKQMLNIATANLQKKLNAKQKLFFLKYKARALNNQSLYYNMQGNVPLALQSIKQCLNIQKQLKSDIEIGLALNNIAGIYMDMNNFNDALKYNLEAVEIRKKINDSLGLAQSINNLGVIYEEIESRKKGLEYYRKALEIRIKLHDEYGATASLNNIGYAYRSLATNEPDKKIKAKYMDTALMYYNKNLELEKKIHSPRGMCYTYHNIASIHLMNNDVNNAILNEREAVKIAFELNYPEPIMRTTQQMSLLLEKKGKIKESFDMYKIFIKMRDSLTSEEAKKAGIQNQLQYQYDKKVAADSVKRVEEKKLIAAEKQNEKTQRLALYGILTLTFLFAMFMLNRFRITRKQRNLIQEQKQEVELQKHMVDEKQRELLDSIHYAKRIQIALLTSEKYIDKTLKELKKQNDK